ncbi:hypothetical protein P5673_008296 [Acropora cervicornis]|uniref:Uncharacterized protein n=1 Tax=Acropora cervicornis TaxID=6130 RepID=A0AAD9QU64_ACRCE|nr:hypothetical protein P5673_008296 [Acropora cervicornis]
MELRASISYSSVLIGMASRYPSSDSIQTYSHVASSLVVVKRADPQRTSAHFNDSKYAADYDGSVAYSNCQRLEAVGHKRWPLIQHFQKGKAQRNNPCFNDKDLDCCNSDPHLVFERIADGETAIHA